MDDIRNTRNNVIFAVAVLILIGVALMYVFTGGNTDTQPTAVNPEYEVVLASVKQIDGLTIAGGVLDDPAFASLQDFSVPVNPTTPPGRVNPFLSY